MAIIANAICNLISNIHKFRRKNTTNNKSKVGGISIVDVNTNYMPMPREYLTSSFEHHRDKEYVNMSIELAPAISTDNTGDRIEHLKTIITLPANIQKKHAEIISTLQADDIDISHILHYLCNDDNLNQLLAINNINLYNSLIKLIASKIADRHLNVVQASALNHIFYKIADDFINLVNNNSVTKNNVKYFFGDFCKLLNYIVIDQDMAVSIALTLQKFTSNPKEECYFAIKYSTDGEIINNYLQLLANLSEVDTHEDNCTYPLLENVKSYIKKELHSKSIFNCKSTSNTKDTMYASYLVKILSNLKAEHKNKIATYFLAENNKVSEKFKNLLSNGISTQ